jgi:hypothetical protein
MKVFQHILICDKNFVRTKLDVLQIDNNSFYASPHQNDSTAFEKVGSGFKLTRQQAGWEFTFEGNRKWLADDTLKEISNEIEHKLERCSG